jgi:putative ABC transport system permease protein
VVTFVSGINDYVAQKVFNLGADVFIIFKVSPAVTNVDHYLEGEKRKDLTMEDYQAVAEGCRDCKYIGAVVRNESGKVKYAEQSISDTSVRGITPSMAPIYDLDLSAGRMLNETDLNNRSAVAVVGNDIVEHLMAGTDPLGKEIRIDGWTYQIIGVGTKKGKTLGQSADNYVFTPITVFLKQPRARDPRSTRLSTKRAPPCAPSATIRWAATTVSTLKPTRASSASGRTLARRFSLLPLALPPSRWWSAAL